MFLILLLIGSVHCSNDTYQLYFTNCGQCDRQNCSLSILNNTNIDGLFLYEYIRIYTNFTCHCTNNACGNDCRDRWFSGATIKAEVNKGFIRIGFNNLVYVSNIFFVVSIISGFFTILTFMISLPVLIRKRLEKKRCHIILIVILSVLTCIFLTPFVALYLIVRNNASNLDDTTMYCATEL